MLETLLKIPLLGVLQRESIQRKNNLPLMKSWKDLPLLHASKRLMKTVVEHTCPTHWKQWLAKATRDLVQDPHKRSRANEKI